MNPEPPVALVLAEGGGSDGCVDETRILRVLSWVSVCM